MANQVFTIGHSTFTAEDFLALLKRHDVTAIADVRSAPYSRFNPAFNREVLKAALRASGVFYVFLGKELGGRPVDPDCYEDGRANYVRMAQKAAFHAGLDRVVQGSESHRIALMCSEGDPLTCHRTLLIARALTDRRVPVVHILRTGQLETQVDAEERLLGLAGLSANLLRSRDELLADAYAVQSKKVEYTSRADLPSDAGAV
jgi:uncharacterized protein (DUF488 family)